MEKEYRKCNKDMINCPNCNRKSLVLYRVHKVQTIYGHCSTPTFDILSALNGEDSHGTAPLGWDVYGL